jgi:hypothetical protein
VGVGSSSATTAAFHGVDNLKLKKIKSEVKLPMKLE